ncbi:mechanosensitive ion channel domain-containing protein [Pontibacter korlensis]|uniref:Mechanosensitive ion channel protein MscS n=1 Tax=Pontibacter korlensis TaxID=400092 RepID=A0A0E3ZI46_9BACT|nr:mechanosensitive ion channel domain-containing protein [Pontibacter korlensis]AKD05165.1 mechanosensitive ion channel protein MscS [Pontibacter korlensis]
MHRVINWLATQTGLSPEFYERLLFSLALVGVLWLLRLFLQYLFINKQTDLRKKYQWRKASNYTVTVVGMLLLSYIWFDGFRSIATFLGLLSAGLVLALREPVLNMAGWVFIIWKRPFHIGDRIQIGQHIGDVIDIRLFQFTLNEVQGWVNADQATGRVVNIPNLKVFTEPQANYNYGFPFIWQEVSVLVTFESNWQKAKGILWEVMHEHAEQLTEAAREQIRRQSQQHLIFYEDLEPHLFTRVRENGIELTMRYVCSLLRRRQSEHLIWEDVLTKFLASPDIRFAYPTIRFYRDGEGQEPLPKQI